MLFQTMSEQSEIGWDQFLKGRITVQWKHIMRVRRKTAPKTEFIAKDADVWSAKVSTLMLNYLLQLWTHRNALVHGTTRQERQQVRRRKAISRVVQVYQRKPKLRSTDDSRYFRIKLGERLQQPTPNLEAWVNQVEIAEASYSKYGEIHSTLKQQTLREWMKGKIPKGTPK